MNSESRFVPLSVFTPSEASAACKTYQIAPPVMENIGNHPLLFRIAHDLGLQSLPPTVGRYKLLQSFVNHQLDVAEVRGPSRRSLSVSLQHAAGLMGRGGSGSIPLKDAGKLFGEGALNAALDAGLLIEVGEASIRFAFDEVAEFLRIVAADPGTVFRNVAAHEEVQEPEFADACHKLLQIEMNGDEKLFLAGCDALLAALDAPGSLDLHPYSFLKSVVTLAQALPPIRSSTVEKLFISISRYCQRSQFPEDMPDADYYERSGFPADIPAQWIFEAALPANIRARLLVDIAPLQCGHHFRRKDWANPDDRPDFERIVDEPNSSEPGALLNRLMKEDPAAVRPVLLAALNDRRSLKDPHKEEATVATMCAGILFHRRADDDPSSLYDALLDIECEDENGLLLDELAELDPAAFAAKALNRLDQMRNIWRALRVLVVAGMHLDPNSRSNLALNRPGIAGGHFG